MALSHVLTAIAGSPLDYIDTRVGTASSQTKAAGLFGKGTEEYGQTLPAVLTPYGMNFWTPQTRDTELKCVAPYYYADTKLQGFRNSHWIVGGCTQDYGTMTLMPLSQRLRCSPEIRATMYTHDDEVSRPDYYSVYLPEESIKAEMTGTSRCGLFRFTYDNGGTAYLVVNPNNDEGVGYIAVDTARNIIYGYNPVYRIYQSKGEPAGFSGHFVVIPDKKITGYGCYINDKPIDGLNHIGMKNGIGCYVSFDVKPGEEIKVKVATSFTSHEGALRNMKQEMPGWNFDAVRRQLRDTWESHLGAITVESDDEHQLRKFYGAMYRASFLPHEVNDVDGCYIPFDSGYPIKRLPAGQTRYFDDYSMWDTYRALHPLITLLYPELSGEMMQSLVTKSGEGGWLPIFPCWGSYTCAMIGDHSIAAIADAYVKGVGNFDIEGAYKAMRKNAFEIPEAEEYLAGKGRRALASYMRYGYVPVEDTVPDAYHKKEQVSRTLEYAFDDFALAQIAKALGHDADYKALMQRTHNYTYVLNPVTGYADARSATGDFCYDNPFDFTKHITEGAPCHYTWYVPHHPYGLMDQMGGRIKYVAKLDSMFSEGRYWHGNEPCHQVAYMYNYAGEPWKTAREVRRIMQNEYLDSPGGLSGNDDAGQMSAWYVFAALGFYPVCPASPYYIISSPTFKRATIRYPNGKQLTLSAPNASDKNIYIKSIKLNGKKYAKNYLKHSDLVEGGEIVFEMTDRPYKKWGSGDDDLPPILMK